jgi:hypothetical protein
MNPWAMGQMADQRSCELRAGARQRQLGYVPGPEVAQRHASRPVWARWSGQLLMRAGARLSGTGPRLSRPAH